MNTVTGICLFPLPLYQVGDPKIKPLSIVFATLNSSQEWTFLDVLSKQNQISIVLFCTIFKCLLGSMCSSVGRNLQGLSHSTEPWLISSKQSTNTIYKSRVSINDSSNHHELVSYREDKHNFSGYWWYHPISGEWFSNFLWLFLASLIDYICNAD